MERTTVAGAVGVTFLLLVALSIVGSTGPPAAGTARTADSDPDYRTVVVFRNDDVEPGHSDDLRRTVDRIFLDEQVPLTSAVIPAPGGESIADDEAFCRELSAHERAHPGLVEYSLHGYRHEASTERFTGDASGSEGSEGSEGSGDSGVTSEFAGLPRAEQRDRIDRGRQAFAECLGEPPRSFVPPYGTYDESTVQALSAADIGVVSGGSWFTETYFGESGPFETRGVLHVPRRHGFVADWDTNAFHDQHTLRERFDTAYAEGDVYVHVLHYWTFDTAERREALRSFLSYVTSHDGVLFLTVGEFAEAHRDGRLQRAGDGWVYVPPEDAPGRVYGTEPLERPASNATGSG